MEEEEREEEEQEEKERQEEEDEQETEEREGNMSHLFPSKPGPAQSGPVRLHLNGARTSQDAARAYPRRFVSLWRGPSLFEDAQRAYPRRLPRSQFTAVAAAALGRAARPARPQTRFAEARGRCCRAPRGTLSRVACIADHTSATRG